MNKKYYKVLLSGVFALAGMFPALANSTQITMTATASDFLVVQVERASDSKVVSGDDFQPGATDPAANEILTFGNIDARGLSVGNLTSTNNLAPTAPLTRVVLDANRNVFDVTGPPAKVAGALYFIKNGYQVRTIRSPGPTGELVTDVDVYNDGTIKTFVDLSTVNTLTSGSTVSAASIRAAGSGVSSQNQLKAGVANNTPFPIDIGLYVDNATTSGAKTSTITFTGT
jgi:hypothetical protein